MDKILAALLLAFSIGAFAEAMAHPATVGAEEQVLIELDRHWYEMWQKQDLQGIEQLLSEDFSSTNTFGHVSGKSELLEQFRTNPRRPRLDKYQLEDVNVLFRGEVAIVTGKANVEIDNIMGRFIGANRFLRVYERRGANWKLVNQQLTAIIR